MSTLKANTLSNTAGDKTIPVDRVAQGVAAAWVNFNGTGTPAIRGSYNVSSITDNGTGDYTLNFTTALSDMNYAVVASAQLNGVSADVTVDTFGTPTSTTSQRIRTGGNYSTVGNYTAADTPFLSVAIFR
jgi:hypothetical protein